MVKYCLIQWRMTITTLEMTQVYFSIGRGCRIFFVLTNKSFPKGTFGKGKCFQRILCMWDVEKFFFPILLSCTTTNKLLNRRREMEALHSRYKHRGDLQWNKRKLPFHKWMAGIPSPRFNKSFSTCSFLKTKASIF